MKFTRRTFLKTGLTGAALVASGALPTKWLNRCAAAAARSRTTLAATVLPVACRLLRRNCCRPKSPSMHSTAMENGKPAKDWPIRNGWI